MVPVIDHEREFSALSLVSTLHTLEERQPGMPKSFSSLTHPNTSRFQTLYYLEMLSFDNLLNYVVSRITQLQMWFHQLRLEKTVTSLYMQYIWQMYISQTPAPEPLHLPFVACVACTLPSFRSLLRAVFPDP